MIENLKFRWFVILSVMAIATLTLIPNFVNVSKGWVFSTKKINYGLDIQGGLHLVLGVDVESVVVEKATRLANSLPLEMDEQQVAHGTVTLTDDKTHIEVATGSGSAEAIKKYLTDYYGTTLQEVESGKDKLVYKFYDAKIIEYKTHILNQAIEVIRNRIDEFGVSEPSIAAQGENRIIVQLPGLKDSAELARAKDLINRTARLNFRPVHKGDERTQVAGWIEAAEKAGGYSLGKDGMKYSDYLKRINEDLKDKLPKDTQVVFEKAGNAATLEAGKIPYLIETNNNLSGDLLEDAFVRPDQFGKPEVIFKMGVEGRRQFAVMSEANVGNQVAIVLDGVVQSAPNIQEKIDSPTAQITLSRSNVQDAQDEASLIATTLRAGALPAALEQLEERTVGPTAGKDSIEKGKLAGYISAFLIFGIMIYYYGLVGVIAALTLVVNVMLIVAVLTSLGATLTLPGVAGIVLTVGMAVDANIIIYERIKDELRRGMGLGLAIEEGFKNAFDAIFDSNLTSGAACIILMYYGTGPVRGFGVTLLIGIITSMFTAIFMTRAMVDLLSVKMNVKKLIKV